MDEPMMGNELFVLIGRARARVDTMTPDERAELCRFREAYRLACVGHDMAMLDRLDAQAEARLDRALQTVREKSL